MDIATKYIPQYFLPPKDCYSWVKKDRITKPPIWCSVDLRDGNQALIDPMSLEEKLEFFDMLLEVGFKEIEVGFPAASETEFELVRTLIEQNRIPEDVTIQVLTQAREHIIRRTFEAVEGAPRAVVHLYNSTSVAQREQVFHKSKEEVKQLAVEGAKLLNDLAKETTGNFTFEYSPESFPGTEVDYAVDVCNAVLDVWKPSEKRKIIINIPTTVQMAMPHVFAAQIEYVTGHLKYRDKVVLSVHPHNDRGCGISDAEMAVLAGADRVEGTLFGNGERTGNVDIVALALNMLSQGVDPKLDFSHIMDIRHRYERLTRMHVHERTPYAGDLVFTAFSGSHQDAISKGMTHWQEGKTNGRWTVPYLPIDPKDIGRKYEGDIIRINSQSGKGGVSFILKQKYGITLPDKMKAEVGYLMKDRSDVLHRELSTDEIGQIFRSTYIEPESGFSVPECHFTQNGKDSITAQVTITEGTEYKVVEAKGNGRLDAVSNAVKNFLKVSYTLTEYEEHALSMGSTSKACTFVCIKKDKTNYWGVGIDEDIIRSSVAALVAAVNRIFNIVH